MDNENKYIVTQWVDGLRSSESACKYVNICYNTQSVDNDVIIPIIILRIQFLIKFVLCFSVNMEAVKPDHRSQYGLPCHSCHVRFSLLRTKWIYVCSTISLKVILRKMTSVYHSDIWASIRV